MLQTKHNWELISSRRQLQITKQRSPTFRTLCLNSFESQTSLPIYTDSMQLNKPNNYQNRKT